MHLSQLCGQLWSKRSQKLASSWLLLALHHAAHRLRRQVFAQSATAKNRSCFVLLLGSSFLAINYCSICATSLYGISEAIGRKQKNCLSSLEATRGVQGVNFAAFRFSPHHTGVPTPPPSRKTQEAAAISQRRGRRGRLYVRGFLSIGSPEPLLPPKRQ